MGASAIRQENVESGLRPIELSRDLPGIADLIEICFGERLDSGDLAAVREMKSIAALGPLLWLLGAFEVAALGLGYVWLEEGRVVGNVSTFRAGQGLRGLGQGWVVANVGVHPDHRQRGIARDLMQAALDDVVRRGGKWVVLQLEHDNEVARALYDTLGFEEVGRLTQWVRQLHVSEPGPPPGGDAVAVRKRLSHEWEAEMALASADRVGGLAWARALERGHFKRGFPGNLWDALNGRQRVRWVVADGRRLIGSLWVDTVPFGTPRFMLLLDPGVNQAETAAALVQHSLKNLAVGRRVRLESSDRDPALDETVGSMGFQWQRTLVQMRWLPGKSPE